jgi:hypothetical protein
MAGQPPSQRRVSWPRVFGLTVAEAMWKKRAVVASRIGGIRDQIETAAQAC